MTPIAALQSILLFTVRVVLHAAFFGATFFLFGSVAGVVHLDTLSHDPIGLVVYAIVVTVFSVGSGIVTGAMFALLPVRSRDVWIAMALGAGVVLALLMREPSALTQGWRATIVLTAALAAGAAAWLSRRALVWAG